MKLNSKNIFARYYNWIYGELPNDVCSFFWGSLFIVLAFPFVVPGRLLNAVYPFWGGAGVWLAYAVSVWTGGSLYAGWLDVPNDEVVKFIINLTALQLYCLMPLIGLTFIALLAGILIGAIILIIRYAEMDKPSVVQNTSDFIGAIRRKHCTKIDWE